MHQSGVAALDLEHLRLLEPREARVREVEGNRDAGHAVRAEPLVRQPEVGPEAQTPLPQLAPHLRGGTAPRSCRGCAGPEVAHPDVEEPLVVPALPLRGDGARASAGGASAGAGSGDHVAPRRLALRARPPAPGRDLHLDPLLRLVAVRRRGADLVHDLHAGDDLAEDRVLALHRGLVAHHDEELLAAAVGARGPTHRRHRPAHEGPVGELRLQQTEPARCRRATPSPGPSSAGRRPG